MTSGALIEMRPASRASREREEERCLISGRHSLPIPPYQLFVERIVKAEQAGFRYGWTYDSHILWQESYPLLALAAVATSSIKLGHCVTNPGIREPTVTASGYATLHDISERADGDGHRPRGLLTASGRARPGAGGEVRSSARDDQGPDERARGHLERPHAEARVGADRARDPDVRGGLRARARLAWPGGWATA